MAVITERWCRNPNSRGRGGVRTLTNNMDRWGGYYGSKVLNVKYGGKHKWVIKIEHNFFRHDKIKIGIIGCNKSKKIWVDDKDNIFYGFTFRSGTVPIIHSAKFHDSVPTDISNFSWNWLTQEIQTGDAIEMQLYLNEMSISVLTSSKRILKTNAHPSKIKWKHCNFKLSSEYEYRLYTDPSLSSCTLSLHYSVYWM